MIVVAGLAALGVILFVGFGFFVLFGGLDRFSR